MRRAILTNRNRMNRIAYVNQYTAKEMNFGKKYIFPDGRKIDISCNDERVLTWRKANRKLVEKYT